MGKDVYEIGELPPLGRGAAADARDARCGPTGSASPRTRSSRRGHRRPRARAARRARRHDGGRRELQQRVGGPGYPGRRHEVPGALGRAHRLPHRGFGRERHRVRAWGARSRASPSATTSWCTRGSGTSTTRGCARARTPGWRARSACGATTRAGARWRQFTKVQDHQCLPKADHLTWEEAAAPDAHRRNRLPDALRLGAEHGAARRRRARVGRRGRARLARDPAGRQRGRPRGRRRVSQTRRRRTAKGLGAVGTVNRTEFDHWGVPPAWDGPDWKGWFDGAKAFGKAVWDALGEKTNPRSCSSTPGRTRSRRRTSCAIAAA